MYDAAMHFRLDCLSIRQTNALWKNDIDTQLMCVGEVVGEVVRLTIQRVL